jgi:hypothetical protein
LLTVALVVQDPAPLRAAPPSQVGPELFDAMGTMADRLARRDSRRRPTDGTLAAHVDVAASYGVKMLSIEHEIRTRIRYEGEAFRRVLALGGSPQARLRAALGLTRTECLEPALSPVERGCSSRSWRTRIAPPTRGQRCAWSPRGVPRCRGKRSRAQGPCSS